MRKGIVAAIMATALIGLPVTARDYNRTGQPRNRTGQPPAAPQALAPVAAFGGIWETATSSNAHFKLILQSAAGGGIGPMGVPVDMQVGGSFTNTDGAHEYDGTLSGLVPANTRRLVFTYSQNNGQSGNGAFTLSADGNILAGGGDANGTHFTWSGHRAP